MATLDRMAIIVDWFDAYREADLNGLLHLYSEDATLVCSCSTEQTITGAEALTAYWKHRFATRPATELAEISPSGNQVALTYRANTDLVTTIFEFTDSGLISYSRCGTIAE